MRRLVEPAMNPAVRTAAKIARYRRDIEAFFREQLKIRTKEGRAKPFTLWPCQQPVMDKVVEQRRRKGWIRLVVLKARQTGLSTFTEALVSHACMLYPHTNGVVIAHDKPTAASLFNMSRFMYDNLDPDIKPLKKYSTKSEFEFANADEKTRTINPGLGSKMIITSANNLNSAVGFTLRAVHLSEAARYASHEGIVDGVFPALAKKPGTMCVIESTAKYSGLWFKDMCSRAQAGASEYEFVFIAWFTQPDYQVMLLPGEDLKLDLEERQWIKRYGLTLENIKFFRQERATIGDDNLFTQNYPFEADQAWVSPGDNAFPYKKLDAMMHDHVREPMRRADVYPGPQILDDPRGRLQIWEAPKPGVTYDCGVDVSGGLALRDDDDSNLDWSAICVMKRGTNEQVAEWRSRSVDTVDLAKVCYWLGKWYHDAQMCIEMNGIGIATNSELVKLGYYNVYRWRYRDEVTERFSKKVGWETSPRTKRMLVAFTGHLLMNDKFVLHSRTTLEEMRTFERRIGIDGQEYFQAAAGANDDTVLAMMIALRCSADEDFQGYFDQTQTRETRATQNNPVIMASHALSPEALRGPQEWNSDGLFLQKQAEREFDGWP